MGGGGRGGPRQKSPAFFARKAYGKESPRFNKQGPSPHDCGVSIYLYHIRCQYHIIWESLDVTWGASTKTIWWKTESEFCTLGTLVRPHILVSNPCPVVATSEGWRHAKYLHNIHLLWGLWTYTCAGPPSYTWNPYLCVRVGMCTSI